MSRSRGPARSSSQLQREIPRNALHPSTPPSDATSGNSPPEPPEVQELDEKEVYEGIIAMYSSENFINGGNTSGGEPPTSCDMSH